ncbi:MAG: UDP-N-acetylmuramoyl-L-alanine--D-glutamate ligase [Gammaproteobacteria bacterium]|nr:UDP-N-acetylmuramoyl-L-alanine--D-glutamate ligase [Gammaproteobacteria bacterium]
MTEQKHGLADVHYLVVGLGKTGLSCVRFLQARGLQVSAMDSRAEPSGLKELQAECPQIQIHTGGFDAGLMSTADVLVVSPGIPVLEPAIVQARTAGAQVVGDVELFARLVTAPVVAITGSNGKSTVTELLGEMARADGRKVAVGGNIGTPVLELLEQEYELYVLELSSFQLETTHSLNARAAVVLNVSPDHMDRYADEIAYAASKQAVYRGDGVMVLNTDDAVVAAMAESGRQQLWFSLEEANTDGYGLRLKDGELFLAKGDERIIAAKELKIPGRHNLSNALAALALGEAAGLSREAMVDALKMFTGLPHRTQWVAKLDGVDWYNDSKGTNVGATVAAIEGLDGPLILIAGGEGKGADFSELRAALADKVRLLILIGRDARLIAEAVAGCCEVIFATDMDDAVQQAASQARSGDSVLLSPACASFDMFSGYEQRGEVFMAAVRGLSHD